MNEELKQKIEQAIKYALENSIIGYEGYPIYTFTFNFPVNYVGVFPIRRDFYIDKEDEKQEDEKAYNGEDHTGMVYNSYSNKWSYL